MAYKPPYTKQDLNNLTNVVDGQIGLHDGTGTQPEGLYWYDGNNSQWVKISTNDTGSSVTIST